MGIKINMSMPSNGVAPTVEAPRLESAQVHTAAEAVFQSSVQERASSSLEGRVKALLAADDLSPDEIKDEADACREKILALLDQVETVAFNSAFPLVADLARGNE